jgi:hypothetical protein
MSEKRYVFEIIKNHVFDVRYNHWNSPKCHPKLLEIAFQGARFQTSSEGTCPEHEPCFWFSLRPSKNVALATPLGWEVKLSFAALSFSPFVKTGSAITIVLKREHCGGS